MIRLGFRAHDYGCLPPAELAKTIAAYGVESVQLALSKVFPCPPPAGALSPGYARSVGKTFAEKGIAIAVLGCYINPVHPDRDERERSLRRFEEHLRFCRDFGCSLVGTETGSCNPDCSWHPDTKKRETFDLLCSSVERLLKTAEKCGSIVGIEGVADCHTLSSIELMQELIERFPSPALGVIYDPVNLIPNNGLARTQEEFFREALDVLGSRIMAVHLKDFRMEGGRKIGDLPAGAGELDWPCLLQLLMEKKPGVDLLLENSGPLTGRGCAAFLRETAAKIISKKSEEL
ncbi:sugar phosphate isomerase/epimerase [Treponema sp. TIM-1]|uniref:sugar phosphate isomerase/epimerase family protein n=1 Tax=Treponema sp. TIM-1 TaxID=2898417 RepID=UPI00398018BA